MIGFVPDHIKNKNMYKHAVKKFPFLIRYIPEEYKAQQMCNKAVVENGRTLKFIPDSYQKMCNQGGGIYIDILEYVP